MARLGSDGEVDPLHTRLAGSWAPSDPLGFEVNGRLWNCLTERTSVQGQVPVGRLNVLFARHKIGPVVIATAVVRSRPFDQTEQEQLAGLLRSAARATEVEDSLPEAAHLEIGLSAAADNSTSAAIELVLDGVTRSGRASAGSADEAMAKATLELFGIEAELRFAASTTVEGDRITIVVLNSSTGTVFGLAITGPGSENGAVEATFSAAISAGLKPLGTLSAG